MRPLLVPVLPKLVGLALVLAAPHASARTEAESPYTRGQTFNGALRYLRVDLDYEVVERDAEAGYVLFQYIAIPGQKPSRGAIEVIEVEDRIKVVVHLPAEPSHHEVVLRDGLLKKLVEEYGEAPPRKKPRDEAKADEDDDAAEDSKDEPRDPRPPKNGKRRRQP